MTEARTPTAARTELRVDLTAGRRGVRRPFGRLVVDDRQLAVRSAATRWIPARSVSKDTVGEISVTKKVEVQLPILRWTQVEVVTFEPSSPFADISIKLPRRKRVVDVLRACGYSVT